MPSKHSLNKFAQRLEDGRILRERNGRIVKDVTHSTGVAFG